MTTPTHYARCPGCQTVFRVSEAQLALREGQVRCGNCRAVFDANRERVAPETGSAEVGGHAQAGNTSTRIGDAPGSTEAAAADANATAEAAATDQATPALEETAGAHATIAPEETTEAKEKAAAEETTAAQEKTPREETTAAQERTAGEETNGDETIAAREAIATVATDAAAGSIPIDDTGSRTARYEWKPRKRLRERPRMLYGAAIVVLLAALAAQALFEFRDALAARVPFTRPILEAACVPFGCTIGPLRDAAALSIDASDLRADPAHRGLLKLSATIRNRASYPIAWPYLELTLTDSSDRVVARRALAPREYLGGATDPSHGLGPNGEEVVTLFLDASDTSQSGYRLYLFYP